MKQLFHSDCMKLQEPAQPVSTAILWCVDRRIRGLRRDAESVMEWIDFLQGKLEFKTLYAMAHLNCAACEGSEDPNYYEHLLVEGGDILRKRLPHIEIVTIFADHTGVHLVERESLAVT